MRQSYLIQIVAFCVISLLSLDCSNPEQVPGASVNHNGVALLTIATATSGPFQKIARKAVLTISATDILTMTRELIMTDSSVEGKITGIPIGKSRLFTISVYDSLNVAQYIGSATSDVIHDSAVTVSIMVTRVTSSANINGTVVEDTAGGYRYYRFVVNEMALGGPNEGILTETHFLLGETAYPLAGTYSVISNSSVEIGCVEALLDGDSTASSSSANYIKFTSAPWEWVIDLKQNYKFDSFFTSSWQTDFYKEPSELSIYGSNSSLGPWNQIGTKAFTTVYQTAIIPLSY